MGRLVVFPLNALSVTTDNDQDIFELIAGATWPAVLYSFELSSSQSTFEAANLQLVTRSTTGSGGSAVTGSNVDGGNSTTVHTTCNSLVTTPGTVGTTKRGWQWSQLDRLIYEPTPQRRPVIAAATRLCLHLSTTLGGTRTWSGEVVLEELG